MKNNLLRQLIVGVIAAVLVWLFWISRPQWTWDMRLWKAFGDGALLLLVFTLVIGPLARIWSPSAKLLPWREYLGIWFGVIAIIHGFLVWNGWARWDILRFFGYEFVPELGRVTRLEPGFGLANLIGLTALLLTIILMATSTERAVKLLGGSSWKWLHNSANIIFYLSALHSGYFLYIHYTLSFHKNVPPPDWFRAPFLLLVGSVFLLQTMAFIKTVKSRRK
ncbi:ferric reductase-like transmembrane domain-containing protein [Virgibacillus sp. DJP39]|uniref:ferric reductase-like transmembrane domain-containing protein n=1 Tax=Virgibacillus sp. DJP39 TaxID=3409790 RepID=UPI003BB5E74D